MYYDLLLSIFELIYLFILLRETLEGPRKITKMFIYRGLEWMRWMGTGVGIFASIYFSPCFNF